MSNILVLSLKEDLQDLINQKVMGGLVTEQQRDAMIGDRRLAEGITRGMLIFLQKAEASAHPNFLITDTPAIDLVFNGVNSYDFPATAFTEREDQGILNIVLDGEEVEWSKQVNYSTVQHIANSPFYVGPAKHVFNVDYVKRKIYAPAAFTLTIETFERPLPIDGTELDTYDLLIDENYRQDLIGVTMQVLLSPVSGGMQEPSNTTE